MLIKVIVLIIASIANVVSVDEVLIWLIITGWYCT